MVLKIDDDTLRQLNETESEMLKYVYRHKAAVCSMSIKELAGELNCAPSSVVRFCKKIGYSGFSEVKYALQDDRSNTEPANSEVSVPATYESIMTDISTSIVGTAGLMQNERLYKVASLLNTDLPVYLYYPGGITDNLVTYLERLLMINGRTNVYQLHSGNMTAHLIQTIPEQAIIIFISASGMWHKTVKLAQTAKLHNLVSVGITPVYNNDVAVHCNYNLRFFAHQRENKGAEFTSRLCIYYLIDTLIEFYLQLKKGDEPV